VTKLIEAFVVLRKAKSIDFVLAVLWLPYSFFFLRAMILFFGY